MSKIQQFNEDSKPWNVDADIIMKLLIICTNFLKVVGLVENVKILWVRKIKDIVLDKFWR